MTTSPYRLSDVEWSYLDALRRNDDLHTAAKQLGLGADQLRPHLAALAEKLRLTAQPGDRPENQGFEVPALQPCPYCENYVGRFGPNGPPAVVVDDDQVVVFLTSLPLGGMPGHTLVTVRRHVQTIFDLLPEEASALGRSLVHTASALRAAFDPPGLLIQQNNGVAAFQTVPHLHFHVIPKLPGPFPPSEPPERVPYPRRQEQADLIRAHWPVPVPQTEGT